MILMKDDLRVALVTGHIPLSQVASSLNVGDIVNKLRIFNQSLKQDFGIVKPRIAVLSLNLMRVMPDCWVRKRRRLSYRQCKRRRKKA